APVKHETEHLAILGNPAREPPEAVGLNPQHRRWRWVLNQRSTGGNAAAARDAPTRTCAITPTWAGAGKRSSRRERNWPRPTRPRRRCCSLGGWSSSTRLAAVARSMARLDTRHWRT